MVDEIIIVLISAPIALFFLLMVFFEIKGDFLDFIDRKKANKAERKELARLNEIKEELDERSKQIAKKEEEIALEQEKIQYSWMEINQVRRRLQVEKDELSEAKKRMSEQIFELQGYRDELIEARDEYLLGKYENRDFEQGKIKNYHTLDSIASRPRLWSINPMFFSPEMAEKYKEALDDVITYRAVMGKFIFAQLAVNTNKAPFFAFGHIVSLKDGGEKNEYDTYLDKCGCGYFQNPHRYKSRPVVCKHMMALAMKVGAVTVDVDEVLNRYKKTALSDGTKN